MSNSPYSISQDEAFLRKTAAAKFGLVAQFLYPDGDEEALATIACYYAWACRSPLTVRKKRFGISEANS